jgi:murein DD-endopeptidase MepM/ murein hydrolase activator NlpD
MRNQLAILTVGFLLVLMLPKQSFAAQTWQAPVAHPQLINQFLQPSSDYSAGHRGVDYLVKQGQAVFAPSDGVVRFAGRVVNRGVLTIQHAGSLLTSFEPLCPLLTRGLQVKAGQLIGRVCNDSAYVNHCGVRTCLHFSLRTAAGYLSPLVTIGGLSPSRLLPTTP